jgi:hypothetical protein
MSTFFEIIQFLQQGLFQKCEKNRSLNYQNLGFGNRPILLKNNTSLVLTS